MEQVCPLNEGFTMNLTFSAATECNLSDAAEPPNPIGPKIQFAPKFRLFL